MNYPIEEFDETLFGLTDEQLDGAEELLFEVRDELLEQKHFASKDEKNNHWIETGRILKELMKIRKERFRRAVEQYEKDNPEQ